MVTCHSAAPSVMVLTGEICFPSHFYPILTSSRPVCPLSPGLFTFALKLLAQFISQSRSSCPISTQGTLPHIDLYTEDAKPLKVYKSSASGNRRLWQSIRFKNLLAQLCFFYSLTRLPNPLFTLQTLPW